jgi:hypothetical protein
MDANFADKVLKAAVDNGNDPKEVQAHLDSLDAKGQEQFINEMAQAFKIPAGDVSPITDREAAFQPDAKGSRTQAAVGGIASVVPLVDELVGVGNALGAKLADKVHGTGDEGFVNEYSSGRKEFLDESDEAGQAHPEMRMAGQGIGVLAQLPIAVEGAMANSILGAATGAAEGETLQDRLINAGVGAGLGAAMGGLVKGVSKMIKPAVNEAADRFANLVRFTPTQKQNLGVQGLERVGKIVSEAGDAAKNPKTLEVFVKNRKEELLTTMKQARQLVGQMPEKQLSRDQFLGLVRTKISEIDHMLPSENSKFIRLASETMQDARIPLDGQSPITLDHIDNYAKVISKKIGAYDKQKQTEFRQYAKVLQAKLREHVGNEVDSVLLNLPPESTEIVSQAVPKLTMPYKEMSAEVRSAIPTEKALNKQYLNARFSGLRESDSSVPAISKQGLTMRALDGAVNMITPSQYNTAKIINKAQKAANKPWGKTLLTAAERGPNAVRAAHHVLFNTSAEYRMAVEADENKE